MKINRVLGEICEAFLNPDAKINLGHISDDTIAITINGFVCYFLQTSEFPFDVKALLDGRCEVNFKRVIPEETIHAEMTCEMILRDRLKLRRLTDGKTDVWVDGRLLSNFEKWATFAISGQFSPVVVYEGERMVGLIMPHKRWHDPL